MRISRTYIATPPGMTIKEQLINRGMSQKEFAARMDMSEKHICRLIKGDVILTPDVALRLEMVFGISARFWNKLEAIYRETLQLVKEENDLDKEIELLKNYPYTEMAKLGWVKDTEDRKQRVFSLRKHFEVVRLSLLGPSLIPGISYCHQKTDRKDDYALLVWAQKAKLESRNIDAGNISIEKLKRQLPEIRKLAAGSFDELISKLSSCGIALVFLPSIDDYTIKGATFLDNNRIVIGIARDNGNIQNSLFHELGHIILGHLNKIEEISLEDEKEADGFARKMLDI